MAKNSIEEPLKESAPLARHLASLHCQDCGWYHFYLWKVELPDEQIYFRSLHGDGGILDVFDGPFESEEEALIDAGNLEWNPRL